jgi:hypothetical protein
MRCPASTAERLATAVYRFPRLPHRRTLVHRDHRMRLPCRVPTHGRMPRCLTPGAHDQNAATQSHGYHSAGYHSARYQSVGKHSAGYRIARYQHVAKHGVPDQSVSSHTIYRPGSPGQADLARGDVAHTRAARTFARAEPLWQTGTATRAGLSGAACSSRATPRKRSRVCVGLAMNDGKSAI